MTKFRDRNGFHQIPEIALVTDISEKQCFLAPSMPWENEMIESYQWKMSIQNPDIIQIQNYGLEAVGA